MGAMKLFRAEKSRFLRNWYINNITEHKVDFYATSSKTSNLSPHNGLQLSNI